MEQPDGSEKLDVFRAYAQGNAGTRETIERAGLQDYADLVIALVRNGLDFPKPADTPERRAQIAKASAILQPRLQHGR